MVPVGSQRHGGGGTVIRERVKYISLQVYTKLFCFLCVFNFHPVQTCGGIDT